MSEQNADIIEIKLPCRPEYVRVARLALSGVASRLDFDLEQIEDLKLALSEACNNVVRHAFCDRPRESYEIRFIIAEDELAVEVRDAGAGFETTGREGSPPGPETIMDEEGGLGLMLIKNLTDGFSVSSVAGRGTVIRMVKWRTR